MKIKLAFFVIFLLASCSHHIAFDESKSISIVFKSKEIKFNEIAFLSQNAKTIQVKLQTLNNKKFNINISDKICINNDCISKKSFNKKYLSSKYPNDILENILRNKPIFKSKNIQINNNGFSQIIDSIFYEVSKNKTIFRDKANNILIKSIALK